ncbi:MAG: hypothetical protein DRO00_07470, partial [Thermoproteota archaeon]
ENKEWQAQGEARSETAIDWNGEYWLIGTSDGWLVRLDGSNFSVVRRVDIEGVHSHIIWTGKYWLGISGVYYCSAFAYDGEKLVNLSWTLPKKTFLWRLPILQRQLPYIWKEISNGTHWLSFSSEGRLLLFNGKKFEEVEVDANLFQYWKK